MKEAETIGKLSVQIFVPVSRALMDKKKLFLLLCSRYVIPPQDFGVGRRGRRERRSDLSPKESKHLHNLTWHFVNSTQISELA